MVVVVEKVDFGVVDLKVVVYITVVVNLLGVDVIPIVFVIGTTEVIGFSLIFPVESEPLKAN